MAYWFGFNPFWFWRCRWLPWLPRWWWTGIYGPISPFSYFGYAYPFASKEEEIAMLEEEAKILEQELERIKRRLDELRKG